MPEKKNQEESILDKVIAKPIDDILPFEECTLPSRGKYYDSKVPGGLIKVRPMGLYADKIMSTLRLAQSGQSISWLFRKCVELPNQFDPDDLLLGDRTFLLYYLRGVTHGNEYEFVATCANTECGANFTHTYDLNELAQTIKVPKDELGNEPFKIILPYMSKVAGTEFWVKIRFLRGYDVAAIVNDRKSMKRGGYKSDESLDDTVEKNLNMVIVEAMGETDRTKIRKLVERLHSSDTAIIRQFLAKNSPGIDNIIEVECPECSHSMKIDLPITESFFRPKESGDPGE